MNSYEKNSYEKNSYKNDPDMNNHAFTEQDEQPSDFERLTAPGMARRRLLAGMGLAAFGTFVSMSPVRRAAAQELESRAIASSAIDSIGHDALLGFSQVSASTADTFVVPPGYSARPLISWGDPLFPDAPAFDHSGSQPPSAQALQFGDSTDGMSLFALDSERALLAVNNEFVNVKEFYSHGGTAITAEDVIKAQHAHGVSIFEIRRSVDGYWAVALDSDFNRRLHARTPMQLSGPAAGHPLLRTEADQSGREVLGTFGNCANGKTPWGTYLTCEENFQDYFGSSTPLQLDVVQQRYALREKDMGNDWYRHDERFDLARHPHEANRFGWVVEVNPHDPLDMPKKRTALGRMAHENAEVVLSADGRVVVYMGDDSRGEHLYRFVSTDRFDPANPAANSALLDTGTLYVARFDSDDGELNGSGQWLALQQGMNGLTAEAGFADQATVLINARLAATVAGGTTMDRPEWVAVHPHNNSVFCTLTNNHNRGVVPNQPVDSANPRAENHYGQIVRWQPLNGDHAADTFRWDLFVIVGNPTVHPGTLYAGSANVDAQNMFNSPDGLAFDTAGRLWIQTDGNFSNSGDFLGMGNNQMLCADPHTGEIRRFATGPNGCELTGTAFTPDQRTLFVGVQHPGLDGTTSHFPGGGNSKPRSTIMMIRRDDGGVIGS